MGNQIECGRNATNDPNSILEVHKGACKINPEKYKALLETKCKYDPDRLSRKSSASGFAFEPDFQVCGPGTVWNGNQCELE